MCLGPTSPELERQRRAIRAGTVATIAALMEGEPPAPEHWLPLPPLHTTAGVFPQDGWGRQGNTWTAEVVYQRGLQAWSWSVRSLPTVPAAERVKGRSRLDDLHPLVSLAEAFRQADAFIAENGLG